MMILDTWIDAPDDLAHPQYTVELIRSSVGITRGMFWVEQSYPSGVMLSTVHKTYADAKSHMRQVVERYKRQQRELQGNY